jgi:hypothetical protein
MLGFCCLLYSLKFLAEPQVKGDIRGCGHCDILANTDIKLIVARQFEGAAGGEQGGCLAQFAEGTLVIEG